MQTAFKENNAFDISIGALEVMSDSETHNDIKEGLQDIKEGRFLRFEQFLSKHVY